MRLDLSLPNLSSTHLTEVTADSSGAFKNARVRVDGDFLRGGRELVAWINAEGQTSHRTATVTAPLDQS